MWYILVFLASDWWGSRKWEMLVWSLGIHWALFYCCPTQTLLVPAP